MSTEAHQPNRLLFVDTLRGLGVLFMIQLHTSHGWLDPTLRSGNVWTAMQFFGGLAAPIFLTLAGLSVGMQWARAGQRGVPLAFGKHIARGVQLIVLGYALRLQMWVIDAGGYARPANYPAITSLVAAYALAHYAADKFAEARRRAGWCAFWAAGAWLIGMSLVRVYEPERVRGLLRVDVLQCIGASLVLLNVFAAGTTRSLEVPARWALLSLATVIALATPWLHAHVPGALPDAVAAYLAQWPAPEGKPMAALFPLFPWAGFACAGAALGLHWMRVHTHDALNQRVIASVAIGAWMSLMASEAWSPVYALTHDHAWLAPLLRLTYKLGLVLIAVGPAITLTRYARVFSPVQTLGRASLLVYWAHLEFAFGAAARPVIRRLDLSAWLLGTLALMCAMWLLVLARKPATRLIQWLPGWPRRSPATSS